MSTFVEPYSVIFTSNATSNVLDPTYTKLDTGANTIFVSWDYPELLRITTSPLASAATRVIVAEIPAGGGTRTALINVGVSEGETVFFSVYTMSNVQGRKAVVTVVNTPPKNVGGVAFLSLPATWWAGVASERANRVPTATDNYSETQCDYRSLLSGDRRAKQIREHNFRRSWGSLRSHRRTDVERKHQHSPSVLSCRGGSASDSVHHDSGHGGTHGENRGGYTGRVDSDSRHRQHERFGYSQGGRDHHASRRNLATPKVVHRG